MRIRSKRQRRCHPSSFRSSPSPCIPASLITRTSVLQIIITRFLWGTVSPRPPPPLTPLPPMYCTVFRRSGIQRSELLIHQEAHCRDTSCSLGAKLSINTYVHCPMRASTTCTGLTKIERHASNVWDWEPPGSLQASSKSRVCLSHVFPTLTTFSFYCSLL